jgi:hypothetical protein
MACICPSNAGTGRSCKALHQLLANTLASKNKFSRLTTLDLNLFIGTTVDSFDSRVRQHFTFSLFSTFQQELYAVSGRETLVSVAK